MSQTLSEGEVLNYTTTGAVKNGELKILGRLAGVALNAATGAGQVIGLAMEGVHYLQAIPTGVKTRGLPVGYRAATGGTYGLLYVSSVATGCTGVKWAAHPTSGVGTYGTKYVVGTIWETATANATRVKVKLIGGPMPALL